MEFLALLKRRGRLVGPGERGGGTAVALAFLPGFEPSGERRTASAELVGGRGKAWFGSSYPLGRVGLEALDWWRSWRRFCGAFRAKSFEGVLILA